MPGEGCVFTTSRIEYESDVRLGMKGIGMKVGCPKSPMQLQFETRTALKEEYGRWIVPDQNAFNWSGIDQTGLDCSGVIQIGLEWTGLV